MSGLSWDYINEPLAHAHTTEGLQVQEKGMNNKLKVTEEMNQKMSNLKSEEVTSAEPEGVAQWSTCENELIKIIN